MKTTFIGGGNMAQAIIGGLIARGTPAASLAVVEPHGDTRARVAALGVDAAPAQEARHLDAGVIVLAVKPQSMREAVAPLAGRLGTQLVVSIAAGVRAPDLAAWLGGGRPHGNVVRAMPNTPALIGCGITGLHALAGVTQDGRAMAEALLGAVGKTAWFDDEAMLDAVTAVSGSGPAYVFYFIEALEQAAADLGFSPDTARLFALETFLGGARLAAGSPDGAAELRRKVTSPKGTTERAIDTFEARALKAHFIEGVKAAAARSRELGEEMAGRDDMARAPAGGQ